MRAIACLAAFCLPAFAEPYDADVVLPAPPPEVSSLAQAEYQKAEQDFAVKDYAGAEKHLRASWERQKNHITQFNLALVHVKQGRFHDAVEDMEAYFMWAPVPSLDSNNAAAQARWNRIAKLRKLASRDGYRCAAAPIKACREGKCDAAAFDRCIEDTQDLSLFYWIALGEFQSAKRQRDPVIPAFIDGLRHILMAYFNAADNKQDLNDALELHDQLNAEFRRLMEAKALRKNGVARSP